jgi:hypothetical protein
MRGKNKEVLVEGIRVRTAAKEIIPISKEMQKRRGPEHTRAQETQIADLIPVLETPSEREEFAKAFDIVLAFEEEKSSPDTSKSWGSRRKSHIRRLEAEITPPKKENAIKRARPIVSKILQYFRSHPGDINISELIWWLRDQGITNVSDTQLRNLLHDRFAIYGTRGRKPMAKKI